MNCEGCEWVDFEEGFDLEMELDLEIGHETSDGSQF